MNRKKAVEYALQTHRLEGFNYTPHEKEMWDKIANGELPLTAAFEDAAAFAAAIPQKYTCKDEREEIITKFMKKYEVAFPDRKPMTYEEVAAYVDEMTKRGRHITFPMVGEKEWRASQKPLPEKRICPETGEEMTRGVRPVTFSYKGHSETVEMPGWYTADGKHGIYNSEDTKVSDAALLRMKAKVKEEGK